MKKVIYTLLILILPLLAYNKVNFYKGSLNEVKREAAIEGKLYFVDFYASYCLPCKLMDQTTFMDEELGNYVAQNYIPLKLNIDAFDAYEIRADYEVQELPTIMIFNSSGSLLDTYKGSLTATALRNLLKKHDLPQNRQIATPPKKEVFADEAPATNATPKPKSKPSKPIQPNTTNKVTATPSKPIRKAKPITSVNKPTKTKVTIPKPNKPTTKIIQKPNKPIVATTTNTINAPTISNESTTVSTFKPKVKKIIPNKPNTSTDNVPTISNESTTVSTFKPKVKKIIPSKPNTSTDNVPTISNESTTVSTFKPKVKKIIPSKSNTSTNNIPTISNESTTVSTFKPKVKKIIPSKSRITLQPEPQKGGGLYEFTSKKHPSNGYGVQIGLFAEYGNVLTEVEKIQIKFPGKKVLVHITEFNGKVVYRVMVGTFPSYALARNYLPQVKANGFEAFIKDLSTLK